MEATATAHALDILKNLKIHSDLRQALEPYELVV
jgi:tRNA C32,U32 (ribose-2'-O)-methylase TrmJ